MLLVFKILEILLWPKCIKQISRNVFLRVCLYAIGCKKNTLDKVTGLKKMLMLVLIDGFGGLVVCVLASGSRVRGFEPGRSRWIFSVLKILGTPSFGGVVK
jgi:hypothetical protein